jgi:hypothetical protein
MSLQVYLDQKIIYETTFHILHAKRSSAYSKGQEKALHYSFTAPRAIVWQGYKDADETSPANQKILGDIWLAGADPDCLILGITFGGRDSNYMNTLHIAHAYQRDESIIASGLIIVTAPIEEKKTKTPNKPAVGNAWFASQLAIGHHWPGVPDPGRQAAAQQSNFVIRTGSWSASS